jgi:hypothetical protein
LHHLHEPRDARAKILKSECVWHYRLVLMAEKQRTVIRDGRRQHLQSIT